MECPKCGTPINPKAMMCIHCGLMFKKDKKGKMKLLGYGKVPLVKKKKEVSETSNVRVVAAENKDIDAKNEYERRDALSTGKLNPMTNQDYLKENVREKKGLILARDIHITDELVDLYIGDKGKKLLGISLNFPAAIFGPNWYLFRRQILPALLYLILYFVLSYGIISFLPTFPLIIVSILFFSLNLFFGNIIYTTFVRLHLYIYQLFHRKMPADQFMNHIEYHGGTSISYAFYGLLIQILCITAYIYFYQDGNYQIILNYLF